MLDNGKYHKAVTGKTVEYSWNTYIRWSEGQRGNTCLTKILRK